MSIPPYHRTIGSPTAMLEIKKEILTDKDLTIFNFSGKISFEKVISIHIRQALKMTNGKIYGTDGAAELLGINPSTLRSKIKKLGIQ